MTLGLTCLCERVMEMPCIASVRKREQKEQWISMAGVVQIPGKERKALKYRLWIGAKSAFFPWK